MVQQSDTATAERVRETAGVPALPDLSGVDLRTLRAMDDPVLTEAVAHVLRRPAQLAEIWCDGSDGTFHGG
ncbi:hypothetical protein [Streptomyces daliensis]|uniref:FXSXX-COOH protein n=1 Tax=Streptomyces daliensis TaxID=299421 RepID=A0A8T4IZD3_9ACTN|nr:hypothetical protein [Streptomyces daliensis]